MNENFTAIITVDQTPEEAFAAITNVRGWWSAEIEGDTEKLGDEFVFHIPDVHYCKMRLSEVIPGQKVVWQVSDSHLTFLKDPNEWDDTEVVFEISETDGRTEVRFTHIGLVPAIECFDLCSDAWGSYIAGSLRGLITSGQGYPYRQGGTFDSEVLKHQNHREAAAA